MLPRRLMSIDGGKHVGDVLPYGYYMGMWRVLDIHMSVSRQPADQQLQEKHR